MHVLHEVFLSTAAYIMMISTLGSHRFVDWGFEMYHHWRAQQTMFALMDRLPPEHHGLVLLAHNLLNHAASGSCDRHALTLPLIQTRSSDRVTAPVADALHSHVTSLCLKVLRGNWESECPWPGQADNHDDMADCKLKMDFREYQLHLRHMLAPLPAVTSLMHLSVEASCGDTCFVLWGDSLCLALRPILRRLIALQSLRICGVDWFPIAPGLSELTGLRALTLAGRKAKKSCDAFEPAWRALRAALMVMPGMTCLCLRSNNLGHRWWLLIRDAVTRLELESLDLGDCELGDAFCLEDSVRGMVTSSAHCWQLRNLSRTVHDYIPR